MKHRYSFCAFILFCLFLFGCRLNDGARSLSLLRPGLIEPDSYVITIDRDTTIETKQGALLNIPAGALTVANGSTATIEIKEAYTMEAMILAGLTTQSDGAPLSSGGMISLRAAAGQTVKISQPIRVALPANYIDNKMQLFKGEEMADGSVNWKDPVALQETTAQRFVDTGRLLFHQKCGPCHNIDRDGTGPKLAHILKRFPLENEASLFNYEHYPYILGDGFGMSGHSDAQALGRYIYRCNLQRQYGGVGMRVIGGTGEYRSRAADTTAGGLVNFDELVSVLKYIQNESDQRSLPMPFGQVRLKECADSCVEYKTVKEKLDLLKSMTERQRVQYIADNGPMVDRKPDQSWLQGNQSLSGLGEKAAPLPANFDEKVSPQNSPALYYQFTIESFGWYNIDALLTGVEGVEESELFVRIAGQYRQKIETFLIIPSVKTSAEGGPADRNRDEFAFFYKSGKLPLPQGVKAYVLAMTETEGSFAFGLKEFTTSTSQELEVSLNLSTKNAFNAAIKALNLDNMQITVSDSRNAEKIRAGDASLKKIDQELEQNEKLKPAGCNCDCGTVPAALADSIINTESKW